MDDPTKPVGVVEETEPPRAWVERSIERLLFASRWLLAPFYVGLILAIGVLGILFVKEAWHLVAHATELRESEAIVFVLSLIDLVLTANLVYMVMLSGYANTVSRISVRDTDRPKWLDKLDMGGLKLKLFASIIAISAVQVLRMFMQMSSPAQAAGIESPTDRALWWSVGIHGVFVVSGLLVAATDWIASKGSPRDE